MWIFYAIGSSFFAGITAILAKCGIKKTDSNVATAIRTVVVLLFSWLMVLITGTWGGIRQIDGRTLLFLILSGLATGASWLCYFHALQKGDINKVVPIDKSSTVLSILLAFIFLHEGISGKKIIFVLLIGIGTMMMITKKDIKTDSGKNSSGWLIYAVLSAVFASLTSILGTFMCDTFILSRFYPLMRSADSYPRLPSFPFGIRYGRSKATISNPTDRSIPEYMSDPVSIYQSVWCCISRTPVHIRSVPPLPSDGNQNPVPTPRISRRSPVAPVLGQPSTYRRQTH